MRTAILACVLLVTQPLRTAAEDKPVKEFTLQKVGLNTTRALFLTLHPKAVPFETKDDRFGLKGYAISDDDGASFFTFLDDKLYMMFATWKQKNIARDKGWEPIVDKIVSKYGKADADSPGTDAKRPILYALVWRRAECVLTAQLEEHELTVGFTSVEQLKKLDKLKAGKRANKIDD